MGIASILLDAYCPYSHLRPQVTHLGSGLAAVTRVSNEGFYQTFRVKGLNFQPFYGVFGMLHTRHYYGRVKVGSRYEGLRISIALDVCGKDS
jgi:hypothetical protein